MSIKKHKTKRAGLIKKTIKNLRAKQNKNSIHKLKIIQMLMFKHIWVKLNCFQFS